MKRYFWAVILAAFFVSTISAERWVVRHKGQPAVERLSTRARHIRTFRFQEATVVESDDPAALRRIPGVTRVQPDRRVREALLESIPQIRADEAWSLGYQGEGITIGIIDSGIDYEHQDLGGCLGLGCKVRGGYDWVNDDADPMDDRYHGTHVAGIAAGDGPVYQGVAPKATLYSLKVLNQYGSGWSSDTAAALEWAMDPNGDGDTSDHLDVVNLSLSSGCSPGDIKNEAVELATQAGVVVVAAASNSGGPYFKIGSPACAKSSIAVAANTKGVPEIASFSSVGPYFEGSVDFQKPDVSAPGVNICAALASVADRSTCGDAFHTSLSGTSMSSPHVAGVAALVVEAHPDYTPLDVKRVIKASGKDLGYEYDWQGTGEVDVMGALTMTPTDAQFQVWPSFIYFDGFFEQRVTVTGAPESWVISGYPVDFVSLGGEQYQVSVEISDLPDGLYFSTVKFGPQSWLRTLFIVDVTAPTVAWIEPDLSVPHESPVTLKWRATDGTCLDKLRASVPGYPAYNYLVSGLTKTPPYGFCRGLLSWSLGDRILADGKHEIVVEAWDVSGNYAVETQIITIGEAPPDPPPPPDPPDPPVDATPPELTITSPVDGTVVPRKSSFTVTADASDDTGVAFVRMIRKDRICTDYSEPYSCKFTTTGKPKARYTVSVYAQDEAGNKSAVQTVTIYSEGNRK